ncbi:MAG TPA: guanylate kinase [bacterium]|nr:guanylate kinase [bacterium]
MKKHSRQFILAVSGVSGSGKDSVLKKLRAYPERFAFSVSYTTRPIRQGEVAGHDYNFVSPDEFNKAIERGEFLEWEEFCGFKYGTKKQDLEESLDSGKIVVMRKDVRGVQSLKKRLGNVVSVFIVPPSMEIAMERLQNRQSESDEEREKRIDKYKVEMESGQKFDYTIINDDLDEAQHQLLQIIGKEIKRRQKKTTVLSKLKKSFFVLFFAAIFGGSLAWAYIATMPQKSVTVRGTVEGSVEKLPAIAEKKVVEAPSIPPETKKAAIKAPPKTETPKKKNLTEETTENSDGSQTTTVTTGEAVSSAELSQAISLPLPKDIQSIPFRDETNAHADLEKVIKDYFSSTLRYRNEATSLREIVLRDAGDTGWSGQYGGQYTINASGSDITSASGMIILNSYYYKDRPEFNEYMKLVFSHEYGHHYTLYHKWVELDLPASVRFPDDYYALRSLPKESVAIDYSKGWENCESEIIAEDYSYLYSGYGLHAMKAAYGYPSSGVRSWLDTIGDTTAPPVPVSLNQAPTLTITTPADNSSVSGTINVMAEASDDAGIVRVDFYLNGEMVAQDFTAPYSFSFNTKGYSNGQYALRVVASDGTLETEKSSNFTIDNPLEITLLSPSPVPFVTSEKNVAVSAKVESGELLQSIEFFLDGTKVASWQPQAGEETNALQIQYNVKQLDQGTHAMKFVVLDAASRIKELEFDVTKEK